MPRTKSTAKRKQPTKVAGARTKKVTAKGGCLCGAVHYVVRGPMRGVVNCHCGQCRKWHGNVATYTSVKTADVEIAGKENVKWFRSSDSARRGFCRKCGSSLFWQWVGGETLGIAAGGLDRPTGLKTIRHIYTAKMHRGDYYRIADGLERLPGTMR